jgi:predicted DCC family thiol-disulfide oxidoreductase YuxK
VPIGSEEGQRLLAGMPEEERLASWHLVRDGRRSSAGAAFPPVFSLLPGGRPLAWLTARAPRLSESAYAWVARNRSARGDHGTERAKRRADELIRRRSG